MSVNVTDNDNNTPLTLACHVLNNVKNASTLLKHGADINVTSKSSGAGLLHCAAKFSDICMIEMLLANGISVNVPDADNMTPLLWACYGLGNAENYKILIQHGADINDISKTYGHGALHYAAQFLESSALEFLLEKGINVNVTTFDNVT